MATKVVSVTVTAKGLLEVLFEENPADNEDHGSVEEQVSALLKPHVKKYGFIPADWDREKVEEEFAGKDDDNDD